MEPLNQRSFLDHGGPGVSGEYDDRAIIAWLVDFPLDLFAPEQV